MVIAFRKPLKAAEAIRQFYKGLINSNEYIIRKDFDDIGELELLCKRLALVEDLFAEVGDTVHYSDHDRAMQICLYREDGGMLTIEGVIGKKGWRWDWDNE